LKRFILILFSCVFAISIAAQSRYAVFREIFRIEDGLSSNNVICAVQDNKGFMWFGTSYGLNKYDGKKFKTFTQTKDGLNSNIIEKLAVDDANRLWIVSGGVLQIMNLVTNEIRNAADVVQLPFEQNQIVEIANNGSREIQIITKNPYRLWYYSSFLGCAIRHEFSEFNGLSQIGAPNSCFQNSQTAITFNGYPKLFLFGKNESRNWNLDGIERRPIQILNESEIVLVSNEKSVGKDKITEKEFVKVNLDNSAFEYLPNYLADANLDSQNYRILGGSMISSTSYVSRKFGLKLKLNNQEIELINKDQWNELNGGSFYIGFSADSTNFWYISTNGIVHVRLQRKFFANYFMRDNLSGHESQVRGIYANGFSSSNMQGELRANVWQSHCEIIDGKFRETDFKGVFFPIEKIQGNYYSANSMLVRLNGNGKKLDYLDTINVSEAWSIFQAGDQTILTGRSPGMFAYNLATKETHELVADNPNWPKPMNVYRFINSKTKGLVAVAENGLFMVSSDLRVIDYFGKDANLEDHRIPVARIHDWHEDSKGNCWIASGGEGLISWKWKADGTIDQSKIRVTSVENGLPSTIIYRIEEDDFLNLWISTYNGLVRYNLNTNEVRIYTTYDGLSHNEFNRISSFKDEQGKLYFGGMNGLNVFDPKDFLQTEKENYPLEILAITKYSSKTGKEENCDAEYNSIGRLILNPGDLFLKIDFAFLAFSHTDRGFQYLIEGVSNTWVELVGNTLQIGALASGEYTVRIRARLPDGTWNPQEIRIPLTVKPPYYLATGFVISSVVMLIIFLGIIYKLRSIRQRRKLERLEIQVSNRTTELQAALNDKEILLKEVHHRVKNNLQVISGLLQLQKNEVKDEYLARILSEGQSRLSSIALIHKNIYQNADLESVFLQSFITELFEEVRNLFSLKEVSAHGNFNMNELSLNLQHAVPLGLILNELMTNSFNHAVLPNQDLEIRVAMIAIGANEFELTYQDNGPGLGYDVHAQVSESLGMRLIFGLTDQINGKVFFEKKEGLFVKIQFNTEVI
jgi:two-component sensor histidine kinase/ligand-binding sensor domain-containing protein